MENCYSKSIINAAVLKKQNSSNKKYKHYFV